MILWGIENILLVSFYTLALFNNHFDQLNGTKNEEGSDDSLTLNFCHFKGFEYNISKFQWNDLHIKIIKCWTIATPIWQFYFKKRQGYENFSKTEHRDGIYQFSVWCIDCSHQTENWQITPLCTNGLWE